MMTRDILIFLAGAEAFHTLTHLIFQFARVLPIKFFSINWTYQLNMWGIIINGLITVGLFWWISKLS